MRWKRLRHRQVRDEHRRSPVSAATWVKISRSLWQQIIRWQERKHRRTPWKQLRRRYGIWPSNGGVTLFDPAKVSAKRYYYRGTKITSPWPSTA
jgi:RNA-directed DNA polymerase